MSLSRTAAIAALVAAAGLAGQVVIVGSGTGGFVGPFERAQTDPTNQTRFGVERDSLREPTRGIDRCVCDYSFGPDEFAWVEIEAAKSWRSTSDARRFDLWTIMPEQKASGYG